MVYKRAAASLPSSFRVGVGGGMKEFDKIQVQTPDIATLAVAFLPLHCNLRLASILVYFDVFVFRRGSTKYTSTITFFEGDSVGG